MMDFMGSLRGSSMGIDFYAYICLGLHLKSYTGRDGVQA